MRVIGGGKGTQGSKEGSGRRERAGRGGEGEAAAVDANRQGQDGNTTNGEKIRTTAKEKEKEKERATHGVDTVAVMVSQQRKEEGRGGRGGIADRCHRQRRTKRRRKVNKGAQAAATKTRATVEEDEAKTIAAINVGCMNNGADDLKSVLRCLQTARRWLGATLM
jgi:chemotaxis response regulator CheB